MEQGGTRLGKQRIDPGDSRRADRRWKHLGVGVDRRDELLEEQRLPSAICTTRSIAVRPSAAIMPETMSVASSTVSGRATESFVPAHRPPRYSSAGGARGVQPDEHRRLAYTWEIKYSIRSSNGRRPSRHPRTRAPSYRGGKLLDEPARRVLQVDRILGRLVEAETHQQREYRVPSAASSLDKRPKADPRACSCVAGGRPRRCRPPIQRSRRRRGTASALRTGGCDPRGPAPRPARVRRSPRGEASLPDAGWAEHRERCGSVVATTRSHASRNVCNSRLRPTNALMRAGGTPAALRPHRPATGGSGPVCPSHRWDPSART